jgi:hypothetical protein
MEKLSFINSYRIVTTEGSTNVSLIVMYFIVHVQ